jgi:AbrB family looped-hinge helix DNA binding protein
MDKVELSSWLKNAQVDSYALHPLCAKYGRIVAMKTTIDHAGRLVIPKTIRQRAGLTPGMSVNVRWWDGHIEIEPAPLPVALVQKGRLLVAVPQQPVGTLTAEGVEQTRQALHDERTPLPDAP